MMMNNAPMVNPMMQVIGQLRAGRSPQQIMMNMMQQNSPQFRQLSQMMQGKSPQQLRQMADNIARERGTTVEAVAQQLGMNIPNNR